MKISALFFSLLLPSLASAATPSGPPMPTAVINYAAGLAKDCSEYGGKPSKSPDFVRKLDLTGDGQVDYLMDVAMFNCEGAASALVAGQSGAVVSIFVTGPNNVATLAYSDTVYGAVVDTTSGKPVVYIQVAGRSCGQKIGPNTPFSDYKSCERPLLWNAGTKQFTVAPMAMTRK